MIAAVSPRDHLHSLVRRARGPQAATPADFQPEAQDEGQPVRAGTASDDVPVRGAGVHSAGQSEEFVAASETGEAVAPADDPGSASERFCDVRLRVLTVLLVAQCVFPISFLWLP